MQLRPAELKVFLVIMKAVQRDRNGGLLASSQIAKRAHVSRQHVIRAIDSLCRRRFLIRVNRATGEELTHPEQWRGRTVTYAIPIHWKERDVSDEAPTGDRFDTASQQRDAEDRSPVRLRATPWGAETSKRSLVRDRNQSPLGDAHSEYSECLTERPSSSVKDSPIQQPARDDESDQTAIDETGIQNELKYFVETMGWPMPTGPIPSEAIASGLRRIDGDAGDLFQFLRTYGSRLKSAPVTWRHVAVAFERWLSEPQTRVAIERRQKWQIARQRAERRSREFAQTNADAETDAVQQGTILALRGERYSLAPNLSIQARLVAKCRERKRGRTADILQAAVVRDYGDRLEIELQAGHEEQFKPAIVVGALELLGESREVRLVSPNATPS